MKYLAVIDFETTGLRAGQDRIIEVGAAIMCDGVVVDTFSQLMNPGFGIPGFITQLTGISNAMVRHQPPPEAVMPRLRAFLGAHRCLAHNASFDQRFYVAEMALAKQVHEREFLCSMLLSRRLFQQAPSHKLGVLVQHLKLSIPPNSQAHRALADVLMTCALWRHVYQVLQARLHGEVPDVRLVTSLMKKPKGKVAAFLADAVAKAQASALESLPTSCS